MIEEHFEELERAFFAAGDTERAPEPDSPQAAQAGGVLATEAAPTEAATAVEHPHGPPGLFQRLLLQLAWARVWMTARVWRGRQTAGAGVAHVRARLRPRFRLLRFRVGTGARLLGNALLGAMPSALDRLSGRRFGGRLGPAVLRPFLVWSGEQLPRLRSRRPGLVLAATVVLASTVGSLWAAVVLAATRFGR